MPGVGHTWRVTAAAAAIDRLRPRRPIQGHAALLLPHGPDGSVDWESFARLLDTTRAAGLVPAVNMDTGFTQLLDAATRARVLESAADVVGPGFLAGAFVADAPGDPFD